MDYIKTLLKTAIAFTLLFQTTVKGYAQVKHATIDSLLIKGLNVHNIGQEVIPIDSAFHINQNAFSLSNEVGYSRGARIAKLNLVHYFLKKKKPDTALILLNEASRRKFDKDEYLFLGIAQWRVGAFYLDLGNLKKAESYLSNAIINVEKSGNPSLVPIPLQSYGALFLMRGNFVRALEIFKRLLEKRREVESADYSYHHEYFNIAITYLRMKDYATALRFARQATKEKGASGASVLIANIYLQMNKPDSALLIYTGVYEKSLREKNFQQASTTLNSIGGYYTRIGRFDTANIIFRRALKLNTMEEPLSIYLRMALNYEKLNLIDSALISGRKALMTAKKLLFNSEIAAASLLLSRAFEKKSRLDSALKYLKLHKSYSDSLFNKDLAQTAADLRVQIETIEKEEEISTLRKKSEVENATRKFLYTLIVGLLLIISFVIIFFRLRNKANKSAMEMEKQVLITALKEKEKALSNHTLQMIHHRNGFMEIEEELKKILANDESRRFHKIVNIINVNQSLDREWDNFNQYFNNVHAGFYDHLKQYSAATLSLHEQRLCALIKMNLASREIATLLNIEVGSVKMAKYRLKKKLNLDEQEDLAEFIGKV